MANEFYDGRDMVCVLCFYESGLNFRCERRKKHTTPIIVINDIDALYAALFAFSHPRFMVIHIKKIHIFDKQQQLLLLTANLVGCGDSISKAFLA